MTSLLKLPSVTLSGLRAAQTRLDASAANIANAQTPGYRRQEVLQTAQADGGVATQVRNVGVAGPAGTGDAAGPEGAALATDLVGQLQAKNAFLANLAVFKTSNSMAGALLDKEA